MIILKTMNFSNNESLASFVNDNNITRENIIMINSGNKAGGSTIFTIFFYGDSEIEEKKPGFWNR